MILVLGGGGQLGHEIGQLAMAKCALVTIPRDALDICDRGAVEDVLKRHNPSLVVNAAAYTNVDKAESEPERAHFVNAEGAGNVAAACAAHKAALIHISTNYVFDGCKSQAYVEDDPVNPISVYGSSKLAGEELVRKNVRRHIILRTSWLYGEFKHNFLKTILRLAGEGDEIKVVADQKGCPTCTRELASAILHIAPRLASPDTPWGTYHFAGGGITTWYDFACHIVSEQAAFTKRNITMIAIKTAEFPTAARRPANSALNCEHFRKQFDYQPRCWRLDATDVVHSIFRKKGSAR